MDLFEAGMDTSEPFGEPTGTAAGQVLDLFELRSHEVRNVGEVWRCHPCVEWLEIVTAKRARTLRIGGVRMR